MLCKQQPPEAAETTVSQNRAGDTTANISRQKPRWTINSKIRTVEKTTSSVTIGLTQGQQTYWINTRTRNPPISTEPTSPGETPSVTSTLTSETTSPSIASTPSPRKSPTTSDVSTYYFSSPPASPTINLSSSPETIIISSDTSDNENISVTPDPEIISISSESQISESSENMSTPSENYMADDEASDIND